MYVEPRKCRWIGAGVWLPMRWEVEVSLLCRLV